MGHGLPLDVSGHSMGQLSSYRFPKTHVIPRRVRQKQRSRALSQSLELRPWLLGKHVQPGQHMRPIHQGL